MNGAVVVCLLVAVPFALANWWSRLGDRRSLELVTKPVVTIAIIVAALAIDPARPEAARWWFAVAFVACLAGDVALLGGDRWFVVGLGAFLVGHLAFVGGLVAFDTWRSGRLLLGLVLMAAMAAIVGTRIVRAAAAKHMAVPVAAYLVVISSMAAVAIAEGQGVAIAGALMFVTSDAILGWNEFVGARRHAPVAVMTTYHAALCLLLLSLV